MLCGGLVAVTSVCSEESLDAEFLEFLGTWDSEDENWGEFLDIAGEDPLLAEHQLPGTNDESIDH